MEGMLYQVGPVGRVRLGSDQIMSGPDTDKLARSLGVKRRTGSERLPTSYEGMVG